jgi:hypothetical protein
MNHNVNKYQDKYDTKFGIKLKQIYHVCVCERERGWVSYAIAPPERLSMHGRGPTFSAWVLRTFLISIKNAY